MSSPPPPSQWEQLQHAAKRRRQWWADEIELPIIVDVLLGVGIFGLLWIVLTVLGFASPRFVVVVSTLAAIGGTFLRHWFVRRNPDWLRDPEHSASVASRQLPRGVEADGDPKQFG